MFRNEFLVHISAVHNYSIKFLLRGQLFVENYCENLSKLFYGGMRANIIIKGYILHILVMDKVFLYNK